MKPPHSQQHPRRRLSRPLFLATGLLALALANAGQVEGQAPRALSHVAGHQDPAAVEPAPASQDLAYNVFAEGRRIGSIHVSTRLLAGDGPAEVEIVAHTKLRVKELLFTLFSLDSEETNLIGSAGLPSHQSRSKIDGKRYSVRGVRGESAFSLRMEANGETHTDPISLSDFDCTSIEGPDLDFSVSGVAQLYRVLDLDRLEIVGRSFTWVDDETLKVAGQEVPCRVIEVSDSLGHSRRWIAKDSFETLIKETGVDQDGPFTVVLTRYPQSATE